MGPDNKLSSSDQRCAVIVTNLSIFRNCGARSGSWFAAIFCLDSVLCTFPCYVTLQKYTLQCQHWDNFRYHSEYNRQQQSPSSRRDCSLSLHNLPDPCCRWVRVTRCCPPPTSTQLSSYSCSGSCSESSSSESGVDKIDRFVIPLLSSMRLFI